MQVELESLLEVLPKLAASLSALEPMVKAGWIAGAELSKARNMAGSPRAHALLVKGGVPSRSGPSATPRWT